MLFYTSYIDPLGEINLFPMYRCVNKRMFKNEEKGPMPGLLEAYQIQTEYFS